MADIVELIRACLALSTSSNPNEAAAAAAKAQELLDKYNLSLADVEAKPGQTLREQIMQNTVTIGRQPKPGESHRWRMHLAATVASNSYCRCLMIGRSAMVFIGAPGNVGACQEIFTWLSECFEEMCLPALSKVMDEAPAEYRLAWQKRRFRNSFFLGAVNAVAHRFYDARQVAAAETKALVVVHQKAVDDWMRGQFGPLRAGAHYQERRQDGRGFARGREAGNAVALSRPGQLGNHKQLPSRQ